MIEYKTYIEELIQPSRTSSDLVEYIYKNYGERTV